MYVVNRQNELGVLRIVLAEQYERHSTQLALLDRQARRMRSDGADLEAASALTAATRRALGDIARALHYLEQGHYGTCEGCDREIPIEELAHRPSTRFCAICQPEHHQRVAHSRRTTPTRTGGVPHEGTWPKAGAPSRSDRCCHRTGHVV